MANCSQFCLTDLLPYLGGKCGVTPRKGGIQYLVFIKCSVDVDAVNWCNAILPDPTGVDAVTDLITKGDIRLVGPLKGSKAEDSYTSMRLTSCAAEQVIGSTQTINFTDYNTSKSYSEFDFWNQILLNPSSFKVGYITCADPNKIYGFYPFGIQVSHQIPELTTDVQFFSGNVTIDNFGIIKPFPFVGIQSLIDNRSYDAYTQSDVVDYELDCNEIIIGFASDADRSISMATTEAIPQAVNFTLTRVNCASTVEISAFGMPPGMSVVSSGLIADPTATGSVTFTTTNCAPGTYILSLECITDTSDCGCSSNYIIITVA